MNHRLLEGRYNRSEKHDVCKVEKTRPDINKRQQERSEPRKLIEIGMYNVYFTVFFLGYLRVAHSDEYKRYNQIKEIENLCLNPYNHYNYHNNYQSVIGDIVHFRAEIALSARCLRDSAVNKVRKPGYAVEQ